MTDSSESVIFVPIPFYLNPAVATRDSMYNNNSMTGRRENVASFNRNRARLRVYITKR